MSKTFRFLVVLAVLGAGSFGVSLLAEAKKGRGGAKAPVSTDDCKKDADCVAVIDECCSCNQGGKQRAIPKKQKDAYEKDRKKRCTDQVCTDAMSTDPTCTQQAQCLAGICELADAVAAPAP